MRVAIVAESFLPEVNGVVNSVLRVLEYCRARGHDATVIAPAARDGKPEVTHYQGFRVVRVPAVKLPLINSLPVGVPTPTLVSTLRRYKPDVVHLASPFVVGGAAALVARALGIPAVAVYQTDVAGYTSRYHLSVLENASWRWMRVFHNRCAMTLAPSSASIAELSAHGVERVRQWGRGVDTQRFHPAKRGPAGETAPGADGAVAVPQHGAACVTRRTIRVGFIGRLAAEKSVERLAVLVDRGELAARAASEGYEIELVIVGDGPERARLEQLMPGAEFTGALYGEELARAYASLDVFVHTGELETFCQAIQEAHASGVPTIAPAAGGPIDLIEDGHNGYLLDVDGFERALPGAVEAIAADLDGFKARAYQSVQGKTWEKICDQLLGYYAEAMVIMPRR
ncbi:glycosyltransferase family 1 protein [Corynebacterium zhongnanshanii]|uniref:Glycosyltransferase family 1 protein n=1 Tax=Corynebacterium zhongnanshanii TaxID=2768834 RepID=A0ABQ6VEW6_9CORY|nr:glycosyltransferase family 1 protein [Corynebacterium zhongnanshanii]KAB3522759.1 glycosyltransferase family 1 protein [Corynebacterium zhongnanshanii]